jgi:hypothetical protein
MNRPVDDVLGRDAAVLRVRGALAFTDASRPGAATIADAAILVREAKSLAWASMSSSSPRTELSPPRATRMPRARIRATGVRPLLSRRLELGLWHTVTPRSPCRLDRVIGPHGVGQGDVRAKDSLANGRPRCRRD